MIRSLCNMLLRCIPQCIKNGAVTFIAHMVVRLQWVFSPNSILDFQFEIDEIQERITSILKVACFDADNPEGWLTCDELRIRVKNSMHERFSGRYFDTALNNLLEKKAVDVMTVVEFGGAMYSFSTTVYTLRNDSDQKPRRPHADVVTEKISDRASVATVVS